MLFLLVLIGLQAWGAKRSPALEQEIDAMMGRSHLVANAAVGAAVAAWIRVLADEGTSQGRALRSWPGEAPGWLPSWISGSTVGDWAEGVEAWLAPSSGWLAALCWALFLLGSVLPDIDSPKSLVGRWIPGGFPGPHRGITHTNWALFALVAMCLVPGVGRYVAWLAMGYALHLALDGLSHSGRAQWYPLGRFDEVALPGGGGTLIGASGRRLGLYRTGKASEYAVLAIIVAGAALLLHLAGGPGSLL